ncbi:MAG: sigma-54 dependent transcriptional regulator [Bacteroidota bacterium]
MSEKPFTVFIVEDNEWYNKLLVHTVSLDPDYKVESFLNGTDLLEKLNQNPDVVTIDYQLPDINGDELFQKIKEYNSEIEIIVISEQKKIETAIDILKAGAFDYIVKSDDIRDRLLSSIRNIKKNRGLKDRIVALEKEVHTKYDFENSILGKSEAIQNVFALISKSLTSNINVSISGETGTGKELVAKAIHYNSIFKNKPFVSVNVAAIPKELFESELFGHEKGSFTGAHVQRIGKFEEANGGTLFLDEIAEMDLNFQAKLLRVIQEKELTRVGSNTQIKFTCRIVVATHKNLLDEVKSNNFREDLYYRLFGLPIHLPPLRERGKDILILAKSFIEKFCLENKMKEKTMSEDAKLKMLSYTWPGNIRELKSVSELSVILSSTDEIKASDILLTSSDDLSNIISEELTLREYDLKILNIFLSKYNNDIKLVAQKLGIGQTTIYRMLKEIND